MTERFDLTASAGSDAPKGQKVEPSPELARSLLSLQAAENVLSKRSEASATPLSLIGDFIHAAAHSGVQAPIEGIAQLADRIVGTQLEKRVHFLDAPSEAAFGSARWHAQTLGGALGMIAPFLLTARGTKMGLQSIGLTATKNSSALAAAGFAIGEGATSGFVYDFTMRSVGANEGDFWAARTKNGITGAATFGAMTATSVGLRAASGLAAAEITGARKVIGEITIGGVSGVPAGLVSAESSSLLTKGRHATGAELAQSAYTMGFVGGIMSGLHQVPGQKPAMEASSKPSAVEALRSRLNNRATSDGAASPGNSSSNPLGTLELVSGRGFASDAASRGNVESSAKPTIYIETQAKLEKALADAHSATEGANLKSVEELNLPADLVTKKIYADGTLVLDYKFSKIERTERPDGTVITRTPGNGTVVEHPDGSRMEVSSYRTMVKPIDGKPEYTYNKWWRASENWESMTSLEKLDILGSLSEAPLGGNSVSSVIGKALYNESDPAVQKAAVEEIPRIKDLNEQVDRWKLTWEHFPQFHETLFRQLEQMDPRAREHVNSDGGYFTGSVIELFTARNRSTGLGAQESSDAAVTQYLEMVRPLPEEARRAIFDSLGIKFDSMEPGRVLYRGEDVRPLVERIVTGMSNGNAKYDRLVADTFGQFWSKTEPFNSSIKDMPASSVKRGGYNNLRAPEIDAKLEEFRQIMEAPEVVSDHSGNAFLQMQAKGERFLKENQQVDLHKAIYEWASQHPTDFIRRFVERQFEPSRQNHILSENFRQQVKLHERTDELGARISWESPWSLGKRAKEQKITIEQEVGTKQNVLQLLQIADGFRTKRGTGSRSAEAFEMAAIQAMNQAGDPLLTTQSHHPTCALASLELSLYTRTPDQATRIVNEVLRTGQVFTIDGTVVKVDAQSLKPEAGSLEFNKSQFHTQEESVAYRSYASQVLQTTLANIYWQRQTMTPDGVAVPKGSIRYEIHPIDTVDAYGNPIKSTQDYLIDYSGPQPRVIGEEPFIYTLNELVDVGRQIAGKATEPNIIDSDSPVMKNEATFQKYLKSLRYPEDFPIILGIDANAMQSGSSWNIQPNHAVSILAPWQPGNRVHFHNTWYPGDRVSNSLPSGRFFQLSPTSQTQNRP